MHVERLLGHGSLNFVLIHNAGGDHHFFTHQLHVLKKFGNVILLDLPGHARSGVLASYNMHDLAVVIEQVCKQLKLINICLVGLNNGANIAIETAASFALPIHSMALIDPPLLMDTSFVEEIRQFISQLDGNEYGEFIQSLVNSLFIRTGINNKYIAINAFNHADKKSLQAIFTGLIDWDAAALEKLTEITIPTLCLITDEHHCTYEKLNHAAPQFEYGKVVGSRCWATLEVPEQVNAMMERFLNLHTQ
jgi:pimeloyl-ACP methyl ester carboxylesterase